MPASHAAAFIAGCVFTLICVGCMNMKLLDSDPYCFGDGAPPASPRGAQLRLDTRMHRVVWHARVRLHGERDLQECETLPLLRVLDEQ